MSITQSDTRPIHHARCSCPLDRLKRMVRTYGWARTRDALHNCTMQVHSGDFDADVIETIIRAERSFKPLPSRTVN